MVFMPHWPVPNVKNPIVLGLERMEQLLTRLCNPHLALPKVVHIAGTNGKGSTLAFLKSIMESAGYIVHRYTSPHLINFNERISVAGVDLSDDELYILLEEVRAACDGLEATFFEITTAAAFLAFSRTKADILLLETGMGGRLDATNVLENPIQCIITPVSYDHMEFLGDTIEKIAFEKAGIIKSNSDVIISWQESTAMKLLKDVAFNKITNIYACGESWNFIVDENSFTFQDSDLSITLPHPNLFGLHQILNASTAVASAIKLRKYFNISDANIAHGITNAVWPARLQKITHGVLASMLPSGCELWLDGAHNAHGAQMLAATIEHKWQDKPLYIINGRTGDRDLKGFLQYFKPFAKSVYGVRVQTEPKAEKAENIMQAAKELGFDAHASDSIKNAISHILSNSNEDFRILVCGSLYLAGDLLISNR
jgi:dihydrofolate synthase/folylpolyglutamate synthase